jgi:tRNA(Ile)-lysidine synthase TilS/MesJ
MSIPLHLPLARPPWPGLGRRLESAVRKAFFDFQLLDPAATSQPLARRPYLNEWGSQPIKIAIALSGGKDSMTLLYLLHALSGRGFPPFELHPIFIGGPYTCGAGVQLSFMQSICQALGCTLKVEESEQSLETLECYSCSRTRRSLLFKAAKEVGARLIAFGHHRDDNAQTLLMNLLHKGEAAGLLPKVPMHRYGITLIRPLIYVAEADIRTFAQQYQFARITCRCPVGQQSHRRKIEEQLCQLEALFPNARENLSRASLTWGSQKAAAPLAEEENPTPSTK